MKVLGDIRCDICNTELKIYPAIMNMKMFQSDSLPIQFYQLRLRCVNKCRSGSYRNDESLFVDYTYRKLFQNYREKFK